MLACRGLIVASQEIKTGARGVAQDGCSGRCGGFYEGINEELTDGLRLSRRSARVWCCDGGICDESDSAAGSHDEAAMPSLWNLPALPMELEIAQRSEVLS
jgi:hypothetical protein